MFKIIKYQLVDIASLSSGLYLPLLLSFCKIEVAMGFAMHLMRERGMESLTKLF